MPSRCAASIAAQICGNDARRARRRQAAFARQQAAEVLAAHELHHEVRGAVGERPVVENRHDRRVLQPRDELRLAAESVARVRVAQKLGAYDLDRHVALQPDVARPVHRAHPTAANPLVEAELAVDDAGDSRYANERGPVRRAELRSVAVLAAAALGALAHRGRGLDDLRRPGAGRRPAGFDHPPAQPRDVEGEADLRRDAGDELPILGRVGFLRPPAAERDDRHEAAILAQDRNEQRDAALLQPRLLVGRQASDARARILEKDVERLG